MIPADMARVWRKTLRAEAKGIYRRHARTVETEEPRLGSTWYRRHKWQAQFSDRQRPRPGEKET